MAKDLSGALFKNDRKEKDTHPDYKGKCLINGTEWQIAAWLSEARSGAKYMILKFSPPFVREDKPPEPAKEAAPLPDDQIPF